MAGVTTPDMVAHASNAGAVGSLACAYMTPEQMSDAIAKTNLLTTRPYAVNLFCPSPTPTLTESQLRSAMNVTAPYRAELGLQEPTLKAPYFQDFDSQFEVILRSSPTLFSFVFGVLNREHIDACRNRGIATIGSATTVEEALQLEATGVTYIVLQGTEAGGHRAVFEPDADEPGVTTEALLQSCLLKVKTPLIAAGGIMNGEEIACFIRAGAQAVQMGTAFLLAHEAETSKPYRALVLDQIGKEKADQSGVPQLTRAFTGRLARGIPTRFQSDMTAAPEAILPFPAQHVLTKPIRVASEKKGLSDFISAWAGLGVRRTRSGMSTVGLIHELEKEALTSLNSGLR